MCFCTFTLWLFNKEYSLGLKLGSTLPLHSFSREYNYSLEKIIIWSPDHNFIKKNITENL